MKKITCFMSCLLVMLVALQAQAGVFQVRSYDPDKVYVYGFRSDNGNDVKVYGDWPGVPLSTLGNYNSDTGIYIFSESTGATIIFNNGPDGGSQTGNFEPGNYNIIYPKPNGDSNYSWTEYETLWLDYTIVGQEALTGANWSADETANDMTPQNGIYTLEKNVTLNQGSYEYKVVGGHSFGNVFPTGSSYILSINKTAEYNVTYTFNPATKELNATAEEVVVPITSYTVIGNAQLLGTDTDDEVSNKNDMTYGEGVWMLIKKNVELQQGNYSYGIVGNYDASVFSYPPAHNDLYIPERAIYDVTFTYNAETQTLSAEATKVQRIFVLQYGTDAGGWTQVRFDTSDGDQYNVTVDDFLANDNFVINEGNNWYGAAPGADNRVDYFNCTTIALSNANDKQNFYIPEANKYTFALYTDKSGNLKLDVGPFAQPQYYLHYGTDADGWNDLAFVPGTGDNEGKLVADVKLEEGDNCLINYGRYWYGAPTTSGYNNNITATNCYGLALTEPNEAHQNYYIGLGGSYTFVLTLNGEHPVEMDVQGFPVDPEGKTVVYIHSENADANLYAFTPINLIELTDAYPGTKINTYELVKVDGQKYYKAEFDYETVTIVLNMGEGNQNQTENITVTGDENYFVYPISNNYQEYLRGKFVPEYTLQYGHDAGSYGHSDQVWNNVMFEPGTGDDAGKFFATVNGFLAHDEFVIHEGDVWYHPNGDNNIVDSSNCQNIPLVTPGSGNFHINEAGDYTFVLYADDDDNLFLDVLGFPVRGDLNGDGSVDVQDLNMMINMILGKIDKNLETADLDGSGDVDVSDVNLEINIILGKSSE